MKPRSRNSQVSPLLVTFADSVGVSGKVLAGQIFEDLTRRGVWYVPRRSKDLIEGATVMFYQAGAGVRGFATISAVSDITSAEQAALRNYGLYSLAVKLGLTNVEEFGSAVRLRPIVDQLDFVSNKKWWGHSLRTSPRSISIADFETIVSIARR